MTQEQLRGKIRDLMLGNVRDGYSALLDAHFCYVMPSKGRYQFQWFWDTCFNVFILCALGEIELARRNMQSLFRMQEDSGFVGHMVFWEQVLPHRLSDVLQARPSFRAIRPHMSALLQPPLVAQAVKRIYEVSKDKLFLYEFIPKLVRFHDWVASSRDFDGDGLVCLISPFESGVDWKPSFDHILGLETRKPPGFFFTSKLYRAAVAVDASNFIRRFDLAKIRQRNRFLVKEVAFNTVYACDLRTLSELCDMVHLPEKAAQYRKRAELAGKSILEKMYDPETAAFYDLTAGTDRQIKVLTAMSFFPILLPEIPISICEETIKRHLDSESEFACPYPVPSVAMNDPSFWPDESLALWRGPTWPVVNWFLYRCLRAKGFDAQADALYRSIRKLVERSGFREYYNPFTGDGYGAKDFTWSALVIDMDDTAASGRGHFAGGL